ncbi:hypothetical protein MRB53_005815 [Persea americana]|uniref:Uncharacterized protein n=1 Tax=Persea americana TaxID=3435 RepID=A0ACC2ME65_PERAE|nr:hypothetical protein MRB53_005815 [Persea americana]
MLVIFQEKDEINGCHRDEYLQWYRRITRNRISRPLQRVHLDQDSSTQKKLESFEKLEKMADPSQMNSFVKSMQRKVEMFKKAWSSGVVSFNIENCINSTFDEEGKADVRSSSPNTPVGSCDGVYGLSPDPHTSTHVLFFSFYHDPNSCQHSSKCLEPDPG